MNKALLAIFSLFISFSVHSQSFNCVAQTTWEMTPKIKSTQNTITIVDKEVSISKFLNGGTETLKLAIDSIVVKDYNYEKSTWYYCHSLDSEERKDILIAPTSTTKKKFYLFDFADDVTVFQYDFTYR